MPKDPKADKTEFEWSPDTWASLLSVSDQLYLNVAGPTKADAEKIRQLVNRADLKYKPKIFINFNETIDRGAFGGASEEKKKEYLANPQLTAGEHATIDTLHNYCEQKTAQGEKALVYYMHSESN